MGELTTSQEILNKRLKRNGADFGVNNTEQAQSVIDLAREVLIEKIKKGETFDSLIECEPDDKEFKEKDFIRSYKIVLDVDGRKTELANAEVHYQLTFGGDTELYITKLNVLIISLREGVQIGRAIINRIEEDGIKLGCKKITLLAIGEFWLGQAHPYFFYKKLGFKNSRNIPEDELEEGIKENKNFAVLMEKSLE